MKTALINGNVYSDGKFKKCNVFISQNSFYLTDEVPENGTLIYDCENLYIFPGFIDVHVHLREPGFFYKETIKTGTMSAAAGGFTAVCSMPNLNPVPDTAENLKLQTDIIKKDALINVYPYASITMGEKGEELTDFESLTDAIAFSDDGRGVQNEEMMKKAMQKAKALNKIIAAHCEDNSLLEGGYIHKGEYAKLHNHKGICSESEYKQIERDLKLARDTGVKYHVCHISAKESVEAIRNAKLQGVDVSCETAPHYLILNDMDLQEDGRFKMNPPIRSEEDRLALIEGIKDGTIDMIATDHAPHSMEEKSKGLKDSNMGVVGLETSFASLYTHLVKTGIISLEKLVLLMHENPKNRFNIKTGADFAVFDLEKKWKVNSEEFKTMGRSTPFKDLEFYGKCVMTICDGKVVWEDKNDKK